MLKIEKTNKSCGAIVSGINFEKGFSDNIIKTLIEAIYEHKCLVIKNQNFTYEGYKKFASEWGDLIKHMLDYLRVPNFPEMMVIGTEDSNIDLESILTGASAIAIGPGLGTSEWSRQLLQLVLRSQRDTSIPLVVDADALNLLSEKTDVSVKVRPRNWVFTPHPGEAAKLLGCTTIDIQNDRFTAIKTLVENWSGTFLLKGSGF